MRARDIMRNDSAVLTPSDDIARAAEYMRYERDACIPVINDREQRVLVGVITARDIVSRCVARHHGEGCRTEDHMTPQPLKTVRPEADLDEIATKLGGGDIRRIPVTTDDGVLLGMVTEADVHGVLEGMGILGHHPAAIPTCG